MTNEYDEVYEYADMVGDARDMKSLVEYYESYTFWLKAEYFWIYLMLGAYYRLAKEVSLCEYESDGKPLRSHHDVIYAAQTA